MNLSNAFEDDLLDLMLTNSRPWMERSFPLGNTDPPFYEALMGTLIIMLPVAPASYWFWQWMGWL